MDARRQTEVLEDLTPREFRMKFPTAGLTDLNGRGRMSIQIPGLNGAKPENIGFTKEGFDQHQPFRFLKMIDRSNPKSRPLWVGVNTRMINASITKDIFGDIDAELAEETANAKAAEVRQPEGSAKVKTA